MAARSARAKPDAGLVGRMVSSARSRSSVQRMGRLLAGRLGRCEHDRVRSARFADHAGVGCGAGVLVRPTDAGRGCHRHRFAGSRNVCPACAAGQVNRQLAVRSDHSGGRAGTLSTVSTESAVKDPRSPSESTSSWPPRRCLVSHFEVIDVPTGQHVVGMLHHTEGAGEPKRCCRHRHLSSDRSIDLQSAGSR
jgi:hypothetical protein